MSRNWLFSILVIILGCTQAVADDGQQSIPGGAADSGTAGLGGGEPGDGAAADAGGQAGEGGQSGAGQEPSGGSGGSAGSPAAGAGGEPSGGSGGSAGSPSSGGAAGSPADPDAGSGGAPPSSSEGRIIGYFAAWGVYGRNYHVPNIPAHLLTHVNYAFANISADGKCVLGDAYADADKFYPGDSWDAGSKRGSFHQLELLKQAHPHLKTLISVGGWTWSSRFSDAVLTAQSREVFAQSCVDFMREHGFDGVDIDWEYPVSGGLGSNTTRPEDKHNYTLLLQALRGKLNERGAADGRHYLLTIAAPAGPSTYANLELSAVAEQVDWVNIMTYDFNGGWSPTTSFNSPLFESSGDPSPTAGDLNLAAAAQAYRQAGVAAEQIVVGAPFYGRGFSGVSPGNNGLFQSFTGLPTGTWEAGVFDYHDLKTNYLQSYTRFWDDEAKVPWLFNANTGVMISYDDPESIGHKARFVRDQGLGGVMFWELSGDDASSSLLASIRNNL